MSKIKRRNVFTIVVLVLLFSGLVLSFNSFLYARRHYELNRTYKQARDDLKNGDVSEALTKFVQATKISYKGTLNSLTAESFLMMARILNGLGKPQESLGYCLKSVRILEKFDDEGFISDYCSTIEYQITHPNAFATQQSELKNNYETWKNQGIENYRYNLDVSYFWEGASLPMPITIEVRNGRVYSVTDVNGVSHDTTDDGPDTIVYTAPLTTIDNIFIYTQSVVLDGYEINGTYDASFGFPTWMCFYSCYPHYPQDVDGSMAIYITNFEILH
jgi:hypothetical protein